MRSVYRLSVGEIEDNSHLHLPSRWQMIWKLKVPPKIKNLVWRVCRGGFPIRARLSSRSMHCPVDCMLTESNYEDSIHILLECPDTSQCMCALILFKILKCRFYTMVICQVHYQSKHTP